MYLGIDVGGTKTLLAVLDDSGVIVEQTKFPTAHDYNQFLSDLSTHLQSLQNKEYKACVAGIPGRLNRSAGIVYALGNLPWQDKPIREDIAQIVHCPVIVENDAKTAALAEAIPVLDSYKRTLYVTIGTGIGSGLVVNGSLEPNLLDSEIGKVIFPYNDQLLSWEAITSGRAIFETYHKKATEITDPAIWEAISQNIGLGIVAACAAFQPEVVIFGGGVGAHFEKFKAPLESFLDTHLHPVIHKPKLLPDQHAELSVIYGCYELAKRANESPAT
jgi:predicted NBD/HSP70 family sugar kinase